MLCSKHNGGINAWACSGRSQQQSELPLLCVVALNRLRLMCKIHDATAGTSHIRTNKKATMKPLQLAIVAATLVVCSCHWTTVLAVQCCSSVGMASNEHVAYSNLNHQTLVRVYTYTTGLPV